MGKDGRRRTDTALSTLLAGGIAEILREFGFETTENP
jgi:hypothetical protein